MKKKHHKFLSFVILPHFLTAARSTLGQFWRDSFTDPMLITALYRFRPEGNMEPCIKLRTLIPAKHIAGFEISCQTSDDLNPLGINLQTP